MASNLFVRLFHGRTSPDQELNDWGSEGPIIGPVSIGMTYGTMKLQAPDGNDFDHLTGVEDLILVDGVFYGDLDVMEEDEYRRFLIHSPGLVTLSFDEWQVLHTEDKKIADRYRESGKAG